MKDYSYFMRRILRAFHTKLNHDKLVAEYSDLLRQCEQDEPHLQPLTVRG